MAATVSVVICGIETQVAKTWYDWVSWLAHACRRRWRTEFGYSYGSYTGDHQLDCPCVECQAWRHADELLEIYRNSEGDSCREEATP